MNKIMNLINIEEILIFGAARAQIIQIDSWLSFNPRIRRSVHNNFFICNGQDQTNCQEIHRPEGSQEAACCPEDRQEERPSCLRR